MNGRITVDLICINLGVAPVCCGENSWADLVCQRSKPHLWSMNQQQKEESLNSTLGTNKGKFLTLTFLDPWSRCEVIESRRETQTFLFIESHQRVLVLLPRGPFPDDVAPHLIFKAEPSHPTKEAQLDWFYPGFLSFCQDANLVTTGEGLNR